jgi:hypothetical protein
MRLAFGVRHLALGEIAVSCLEKGVGSERRRMRTRTDIMSPNRKSRTPKAKLRTRLAVAILCGGFLIGSTNANAEARVEYIHPENFTDVSFRSMTRQGAQNRLERELTHTIEVAAAHYLGAFELDVRIMDVSMAGREAFERPGLTSDLRIRNSLGKPPKITVQYQIKDNRGQLVAQGGRVLTNLNYQWDYPDSYTDTLYPEKQLLRDWIRGLSREVPR